MFRPICAAAIAALFLVVGSAASVAGAGLLTIEEALDLSQKTGRPIFAVAGEKS